MGDIRFHSLINQSKKPPLLLIFPIQTTIYHIYPSIPTGLTTIHHIFPIKTTIYPRITTGLTTIHVFFSHQTQLSISSAQVAIDNVHAIDTHAPLGAGANVGIIHRGARPMRKGRRLEMVWEMVATWGCKQMFHTHIYIYIP